MYQRLKVLKPKKKIFLSVFHQWYKVDFDLFIFPLQM